MAIKMVHREWCACTNDYRCEFIVDSSDDFENLPQSCVGSVALSPNGDVMLVNASNEWVPFGG